MIADATAFVSGAISAIGDLISPSSGGTGNEAIGWAALLALAVSGGVVGLAVRLVKKFSRN